jgi:hypothetical protein
MYGEYTKFPRKAVAGGLLRESVLGGKVLGLYNNNAAGTQLGLNKAK